MKVENTSACERCSKVKEVYRMVGFTTLLIVKNSILKTASMKPRNVGKVKIASRLFLKSEKVVEI